MKKKELLKKVSHIQDKLCCLALKEECYAFRASTVLVISLLDVLALQVISLYNMLKVIFQVLLP